VNEYYVSVFIYQCFMPLVRYEGQRDMLYNQTFNLDQVQFASEGIKDAQQTVCIKALLVFFVILILSSLSCIHLHMIFLCSVQEYVDDLIYNRSCN